MKLKNDVTFICYFIVSGIALVKPEKAETIGNELLEEARRGGIPGKLTDQQLIQKIKTYYASVSDIPHLTVKHKRSGSNDEIDLSEL
jgi:hypothetical protein